MMERPVSVGLFIVAAVFGWLWWAETVHGEGLENLVSDMCGLKVVIPLKGPTELEAFVNAQVWPGVCGSDPWASHSITEVRPEV